MSAHLPFIIYTPERTGSTTLARLLNCHPAILCQLEPFNPGFNSPAHFLCRTLLQSQGLDAAVQSLWDYGRCTGFKHVWHADGWPFVGEPQRNHQLLRTATRSIILLNRRNALQRAISGQISRQMRLWVPNSPADFQKIRRHHFGPLNIDQLRREIAEVRAEHQRVRELTRGAGKPWCEVAYEDYFAPGMAMPARIAAVQRLLAFLELEPIRDPQRLAAMEKLFDPAVTGFQNAAAYQRIPNIRKVEQELANAEDGFVFEP